MQNINSIFQSSEDQMRKAIEHLENELSKIRAGKANPHMLEGIMVDYYGSNTPLSQVSNITTPDARTIVIQPWEKGMLVNIEKGIMAANIGLTPMNDGSVIRLNIPPLTEERRKELVKKTKQEGENTKVSIRNIRKEANDLIKKELKNGLPEDMAKNAESNIQTTTDQYIQKVDKHLETKEKEIMTV